MNVIEARPATFFGFGKIGNEIEWDSWKKLHRKIVDDYNFNLCKRITNNDKIRITVELEGWTYTKLKRSLRMTTTDKLGSIGGTLGLFSGFSLLAIIEIIHWVGKICCSIINRKHGSQLSS